MNGTTLADQLEIWGVEDDYSVYTDGSLGFALSIEPQDVSSDRRETKGQKKSNSARDSAIPPA